RFAFAPVPIRHPWRAAIRPSHGSPGPSRERSPRSDGPAPRLRGTGGRARSPRAAQPEIAGVVVTLMSIGAWVSPVEPHARRVATGSALGLTLPSAAA